MFMPPAPCKCSACCPPLAAPVSVSGKGVTRMHAADQGAATPMPPCSDPLVGGRAVATVVPAASGSFSGGGCSGEVQLLSESGSALGCEEPTKQARGLSRPAPAPAGSRDAEIGERVFHELWPGGVHNGYSLDCKHHAGCKKACSFGKHMPRLTRKECRRRLLAWEAAGADLQGSVEEQIQQHKDLGMSRLLSAFEETVGN